MYRLENINALNWINPAGSYLVLISPEAIPHLAILHKGRYFSLTHKKAHVNEDFKPYFDFLKRTGRSVLFVRLNHEMHEIQAAFEQYEKAVVGKTTCLHPIRDLLAPRSHAAYIFELLPELESKGMVAETQHINMDDLLDQKGGFELNTYDKDSIFAYIETLNEKHAKRG